MKKAPLFAGLSFGADDGTRTRDTWLGKPVLYQLSYVRAAGILDDRYSGQAAARRRRVSARCSGSTLTSASTGMKFVSPPQRGTTCRWT